MTSRRRVPKPSKQQQAAIREELARLCGEGLIEPVRDQNGEIVRQRSRYTGKLEIVYRSLIYEDGNEKANDAVK